MSRRRLPELFGQQARNRYLVSVAVEGSAPVRAIARRTGLDSGHGFLITKHFKDIGILERSENVVGLRSFFAAEELEALLYKLSGSKKHRFFLKNDDYIPAGLDALLGGRVRTRVLVLLSSIGEMTGKDLARLSNVSHGSVRHAIAHFARERIVNVIKNGAEKAASLSSDFEAANELRLLTIRIGEQLYDLTALRAMYNEMIEGRARRRLRSNTPDLMERLLPFGYPDQSRALVEIARRDVVNFGELERALGWNQSRTRAAVKSLDAHALVVTQIFGSGPLKKRWLALNPRHPLRAPLRDYAVALCGTRILHDGPRPIGFPQIGQRYKPGEIPACLIGEETPNRIMLALGRAANLDERSLCRELYATSGVPRRTVRKWVFRLHGSGLILCKESQGTMMVCINPTLQQIKALGAVLQAANQFLEQHGSDGKHQCASRRKRGWSRQHETLAA